MIKFSSKLDDSKLSSHIDDEAYIDIDRATFQKIKKIYDALDSTYSKLYKAAEEKYGTPADMPKIGKNAGIVWELWPKSNGIVSYEGKHVQSSSVKYVLNYSNSYTSINSGAKKELAEIEKGTNKQLAETKKVEEKKKSETTLTASQKQKIKQLEKDWEDLRSYFGSKGYREESQKMRTNLYSKYMQPLINTSPSRFDKDFKEARDMYDVMLNRKKALSGGGLKWPTGFTYAR